MASSNSATPMSLSFLAAVQKIGNDGPGRQGSAAAPRSVPRREMSPSSRYFSMRASSPSTMASIELRAGRAKSTEQPAGVLRGRIEHADDAAEVWPDADGRVEQDAALAEGLAGCALSSSSKWMLSASSLLMTRTRARPRLPASLNMRRVLTWMPAGPR